LGAGIFPLLGIAGVTASGNILWMASDDMEQSIPKVPKRVLIDKLPIEMGIVTSPSFCTTASERVYITARAFEFEFGGTKGL